MWGFLARLEIPARAGTVGDCPLGVSEALPTEESVPCPVGWAIPSHRFLPSKRLFRPNSCFFQSSNVQWCLAVGTENTAKEMHECFVLVQGRKYWSIGKTLYFLYAKLCFLKCLFLIEKLFLANFQLANCMIDAVCLVVLLDDPLQWLIQQSVSIQMGRLHFLIN